MQISRHWRMNSQRYRLEGVRYQTGEVSLQDRPIVHEEKTSETVQELKDSRQTPAVVYAA